MSEGGPLLQSPPYPSHSTPHLSGSPTACGQSFTLVETTSPFASGNNQVSGGSMMARLHQESCSLTMSNPHQSSLQTMATLLLYLFAVMTTIRPWTSLISSYCCELGLVATAPDIDLCCSCSSYPFLPMQIACMCTLAINVGIPYTL